MLPASGFAAKAHALLRSLARKIPNPELKLRHQYPASSHLITRSDRD